MSEAYRDIFDGASVVPRPDRFPEFWSGWPDHQRKVAKAQCAAKWKARNLDAIADRIIAHIEHCKKHSDDWLRGFVPMPSTYLNQSRWESFKQSSAIARPSEDVTRTVQWFAEQEAQRQAIKRNTVNARELAAQVKARLLARKYDAR